ncbi:kinesin-like protein KIN-14I [Magnolia sinica]|uniref:kinesin-like protein KIN-14I n=1 Tax=Magnolia sinica TaxID=86752 RepID=UPI0026598754|nr:kinesin-like protein KIN-14I [Magnolia sinica]
MADGGILSFSVASVVEDVLRQHGSRLSDIDLAWRKAEEAALRRYEAAGWLRKMVGVVGGKDLPAEPSEEGFRLGLRNGIILCNVLNKVHPGSIPKVVEAPVDSVLLPDGAALSAYQYFENVRNFLNAVQEMGLPTFEASDLEQGGKGTRVVNCVLALKSYSDWKHIGGNGSWKYVGSLKSFSSGKSFVRKNTEPFMKPLSRNASMNERLVDGLPVDQNSNEDLPQGSPEMISSGSLNIIRAVLSDKKPEEVPILVESMLNKVMEEFERRLASQNELVKPVLKDLDTSDGNKFLHKDLDTSEGNKSPQKDLDTSEGNKSPQKAEGCGEMKKELEDEDSTQVEEGCFHVNSVEDEESKHRILKQQLLFDQQKRDIQELKHTLRTTKAGMQFIQMKYSEEFSNLGRHLAGLTHAASGYHRVLEENRKLYNQVQDLKGSIRVYCRVRPFLPGQPHRLTTVDRLDDGSITIITPSKYGKEGRKSFNFNKVFGPSAAQEEVFTDTQPLIRSVLDGYNVCIFAYGQTGSGKTHTMTGPRELTEQTRGVNFRALGDLFQLSKQRRDAISYDISVQMMEIYNEQVRDLLVTDGLNKRLEIRNTSQKGFNVPDASLVPVSSTSDVIELMNIGHRNRTVSATALNDRSSRSHSCLTVHVQGRDLVSGTTLRGSMHLVDLAGSERVDKSEVTGDRLKEAQHINKSLSALGDVISALAQKNSHVPYRNSKLTQLLQDSLGGHAKTLMFVHISPEADAIGETISTLKFAERVATVELGTARTNKEGGDVRELKEQIANLKAALARKEGESEHIQSLISSPEVQRTKVGLSSPIYSYQHDEGEMSAGQNYHRQLVEDVGGHGNHRQPVEDVGGHCNHRQPLEDVGEIELGSNSGLRQNGSNFDPQDLLLPTNLAPWTETSPKVELHEGDERETVSGDWVDKIAENRQEVNKGSDNPSKRWEGSSSSLPELFYQTYHPSLVTCTDKQSGRQGSRKENRENEMAMTDDSDLEMATSDSSEADWQLNLPRTTSMDSLNMPKIKKPQSKLVKSSGLRSPSPSLSWKATNGGSKSLSRTGRPPSVDRRPPSVDRRRSSSVGKNGRENTGDIFLDEWTILPYKFPWVRQQISLLFKGPFGCAP